MKKLVNKFSALALALVLVLGLCPTASQARNSETLELVRWEFHMDVDHWYHWESNYHGVPVSLSCSDRRLKALVDFSQDGDSAGAQVAIGYWHEGFKAPYGNRITVELLFEREKLDGSLTLQATSTGGIDASAAVLPADGRDAGDGLSRTTVVLDFPALPGNAKLKDLTLHFFGNRTSYAGNLYIERVSLWHAGEGDAHMDNALDSAYVNASLLPADSGACWVQTDGLLTPSSQGAKAVTRFSGKTLRLVDPKATREAQTLYLYLQAVGNSDSVIFGQEENTWSKAGSPTLSWSDTMDLTGSYAGIVGIDTTTITSEYPVALHNNRFGTEYKDTVEDRIKACADMCNWSIGQGAIITLSTHMPNFTKIKSGTLTTSYCGYDFTPGTSYDMENDPVHAILPGGAYHQVYRTYLGMIATFAKRVKGPILFRPLPENPGDWTWWGTAGCDADSYRQLYRCTVEILRDECRVHNLLYVYSPAGDFSTAQEYAARYPGDAYVDVMGFGLYHKDPAEGDGWMEQLQSKVELVDDLAEAHHKLMALTETGAASSQPFDGCATAALQLTGNAYPDWYREVLDILSPTRASYLLTWRNSFRNGFYTPFAAYQTQDGTIRGHELMDNFIRFYNDPRSLFAVNQKAVQGDAFPRMEVLPAVEPGGIVETVVDSAAVQKLSRAAGAGATVVLAPKNSPEIDPSGSRLTVKAADLEKLGGAGNTLLVEGPAADLLLTNETLQMLGKLNGTVCFTALEEKNNIEVSVLAGNTRLTYLPGGLRAVLHGQFSDTVKVQLVTAKTAFPYGDPLEALLGPLSTASRIPNGTYTADLTVKNGQVTA